MSPGLAEESVAQRLGVDAEFFGHASDRSALGMLPAGIDHEGVGQASIGVAFALYSASVALPVGSVLLWSRPVDIPRHIVEGIAVTMGGMMPRAWGRPMKGQRDEAAYRGLPPNAVKPYVDVKIAVAIELKLQCPRPGTMAVTARPEDDAVLTREIAGCVGDWSRFHGRQ